MTCCLAPAHSPNHPCKGPISAPVSPSSSSSSFSRKAFAGPSTLQLVAQGPEAGAASCGHCDSGSCQTPCRVSRGHGSEQEEGGLRAHGVRGQAVWVHLGTGLVPTSHTPHREKCLGSVRSPEAQRSAWDQHLGWRRP